MKERHRIFDPLNATTMPTEVHIEAIKPGDMLDEKRIARVQKHIDRDLMRDSGCDQEEATSYRIHLEDGTYQDFTSQYLPVERFVTSA